MDKFKLYNCISNYNKEKDIYIFYPTNKTFKIKIINNDEFSFYIKTKNKINFKNIEGDNKSYYKSCKNTQRINVKNKIKIIGNIIEGEKINKIYIKILKKKLTNNSDIILNELYKNDSYYNDISEFCKIYGENIEDIFSNKKIEFRYFCFRYIDYIKNLKLPNIEKNLNYEAVLIEYRIFPHIEFILRNIINKLGESWSHTIICGNINYNFMLRMCSKISSNIKIINSNYDNLNQSSYSTFLSSSNFWNLLTGEKILIYQEDSCIFKLNIEDFLDWDYIGAPWPEYQNDNKIGVGNGGFSLRTKKCMLDVIEKISINDTVFNSDTINYMKNTGQTIGPEDVYFTLNMINYNIGNVADRDVSSLFSTELIYNINSLGGHNFWLSTTNWKDYLYKHIFFTKLELFNICAISSPYGLNIGGGENYLLNFARYMINYKNCFIYMFNDEKKEIAYKTITNVLGENYYKYFIFYKYYDIQNYVNKVDYHFDMNNFKFPGVKGCAKNINNNFYHCQFPFDTIKNTDSEYINSYKNIILNSEYTNEKYILYTNKDLDFQKIYVLYPKCFLNLNTEKYVKEENSFVMIGRIFDYNPNANNKNFDIALKYFEKLSQNNINNFYIYIIGQVYSLNMLNILKSYKITNIHFYTNISDEDKNNIFKKSKYIINMVGINRDIEQESYAYEHFGISILEGINYGCIPITINGGFPSYYIKNNESGFVFNNEDEFYNIINNIILNDDYNKFNYEYYNILLNKFNKKSYNKKLKSIFDTE